jgi:serine/threonine protein kinase
MFSAGTAVATMQQSSDKAGSGGNRPKPLAASLPARPTNALTPRVHFQDVYECIRELRTGTYATVWEAKHRRTQDSYAVKIINRKGLPPKDDEAVLNEVAMMQSLSGNKYVVQLMDFYEEHDYFFIVMGTCRNMNAKE